MNNWLMPLWPFTIFALLTMVIIWEVQRRTKNAGYVDVAWALLLGIAAIYFGWISSGDIYGRMIITALGGLWGFRLGLHLLVRVRQEPEDGRYHHLRQHWKNHQGKFLGFFIFQAVLTVLFSLPFLAVAQNPMPPQGLGLVFAITIWIVSLLGEAIADQQLANFRGKEKNRGKTCRIGLWRYTRHPNYFFEWLHWFAYVILAIGSPLFWASLVGPVLMFLSLRFITGVPYVEAQSLRSRGDDYRNYQRSTNAFFPWWPKNE